MAFTRKMLKALGIEEDKIEQIMEAHTEVTDALIVERDTAKAAAGKLPEVQEELKKVKNDLKEAEKVRDDYKTQFETVNSEHEKLTKEITEKATAEKTDKALYEWAKKQGYSENGAKKIVKYGGYRNRIKFDDDGKPTNLDELADDVATEWGEYKGSEPKTETHKGGEPMTGGTEPKQSLAAQYYADYMSRVYGTNSTDTNSNSNKEG